MDFIIMVVTREQRMDLVIYSFGVHKLPLPWTVVFIGYFTEL